MNWKWEKYTSIITESKPLVKGVFALSARLDTRTVIRNHAIPLLRSFTPGLFGEAEIIDCHSMLARRKLMPSRKLCNGRLVKETLQS